MPFQDTGSLSDWSTTYLEDRFEQSPAEDQRAVVVRQRVAEGGHVTVAEPARVIHLSEVEVATAALGGTG